MNVPNILSSIRIILAFIFAILLFNSYRFLAAGIFLLAILTDLADGYLARKYNQITLLGKILDPAADRLLMLLAFLILFLKQEIPMGLAILAISYHLIIVVGWIIVFQTKKVAIEHSFWGKLNSFLQTVMFMAVIFNFYTNAFFIIVTCSILIAFVSYVWKAVVTLQGVPKT